ncbi:response regulator [Gemmatimonadota bacterium]
MASILVIDDDPSVREVLRKVLERAGHTVLDAKDGKQALRMFARNPTDVVISDMYMPEMNGIEFLIRVREAFPEARIIAMSGGGFLDQESVLAAASKLGAVGVLEKPFSPEECLEVVQTALDEDE